MFAKTKFHMIVSVLLLALIMTIAAVPAHAVTPNAPSGTRVTKIRLNGFSAEANLNGADVAVGGFLAASQDLINNTVSLDFGYSFIDPTNPDYLIIIQGAGEIRNTALTITRTSAHLAVTTPPSYFIIRCPVNVNTGEYTCEPGDPVSFDLTWVGNDFYSLWQKTKRIETLGPITSKFEGEFNSVSATVNGTWADIPGAVMSGNLLDTHGKTFYREVTVNTTP
jgi:hypothetical protein